MSSGKPRKAIKTAIRLTFYAVPLLLLVGTLWLRRQGSLPGIDFAWLDADWEKIEEVQLLAEYLRFDTSPEGNEIPAAEFLAGILERNGIEAHIERVGDRNANLWATLEGTDPRALALHHHIDVMPVLNLEDWRVPPFSGTIRPPFLIGRGAFDMKSYGIAQLMAFLDLKRRNVPLKRSVMFLATGSEERWGLYGARHVLEVHPEMPGRIWGLLTEGGAIEALDIDRIRYWGTEFMQRAFFQIEVCSPDRESLEDLDAVLSLNDPRGPRRLVDGSQEFLKEYGATRDRPVTRELLADPDGLIARLRNWPADVEVTELPPYIDAMLRDQIVVVGPRKTDDGWVLLLDLWALPGTTFEEMKERFIGDELEGYTYVEHAWQPAGAGSSTRHELFVELDRYMAEARPGVAHGPLFVPWAASEARYFRPAGIPTFGFSPFVLLSGDSSGVKWTNERIPLREFVAGVELYRGLVERLAAREPTAVRAEAEADKKSQAP
jgi:acetylornithine deacetylase/succinyl-diaminopimelate desuccinylase-like protein